MVDSKLHCDSLPKKRCQRGVGLSGILYPQQRPALGIIGCRQEFQPQIHPDDLPNLGERHIVRTGVIDRTNSSLITTRRGSFSDTVITYSADLVRPPTRFD